MNGDQFSYINTTRLTPKMLGVGLTNFHKHRTVSPWRFDRYDGSVGTVGDTTRRRSREKERGNAHPV